MESEQQIDISKIFHLEKELLDYLKKEEKEELSSLKRPRNKVVSILKSAFSVFRNPESEDSKRGKEEIIEELLTYFKKLEERRDEHLVIKYLNRLNEDRLKELYGIELNKYNLKSKIEVYSIASDHNIYFSTNQIAVKSYMPTKENLMGASKLISDIIAVLEQLKGNEPNKNKIN